MKKPFGLWVKLSHSRLFTAHNGGFALFVNSWTLSREAAYIVLSSSIAKETLRIFLSYIVFYRLWFDPPGIKRKYTFSLAGVLFTRWRIGMLQNMGLCYVSTFHCRKIRNQVPIKVQLNVYCNLMVGYLAFLVGIEKVDDNLVCSVVASVLHFAFLAGFCWMAVYGHQLYQSFWKKVTFIKIMRATSGADLCWALGGIICNFTPILPYFQHWRMNLDHDFVQVWKFSEDQINANGTLFSQIQVKTKKRSSLKIEHFFYPNSGEDQKKKKRSLSKIQRFFPQFLLRCTVHPFKLLGGGYNQIIGGIYPPKSPPCFGTPARNKQDCAEERGKT